MAPTCLELIVCGEDRCSHGGNNTKHSDNKISRITRIHNRGVLRREKSFPARDDDDDGFGVANHYRNYDDAIKRTKANQWVPSMGQAWWEGLSLLCLQSF